MINMKLRHLFILSLTALSLMLITACSAEVMSKEPQAATLVESKPSNTQAISEAMSLALNGKKVRLTSSAFIETNKHTLEKRAFTGNNGPNLDGLILGIPAIHRFSLFIKGKSCYLEYEKTKKLYPLNGVNCIAL